MAWLYVWSHPQFALQLTTAFDRIRKLEDRLSVFSTETGVDLEDLERALDHVRREREGLIEFGNSNALQRKVQALEVQNRDLLVELQQARDMLNLQNRLNK